MNPDAPLRAPAYPHQSAPALPGLALHNVQLCRALGNASGSAGRHAQAQFEAALLPRTTGTDASNAKSERSGQTNAFRACETP